MTTSTDKNPSFSYPDLGTYTVTLESTENGITHTAIHTVTIVELISASFTYSATLLNVDFTDTSTDDGGTINSWLWTFGDGNTSTDQNPSNSYASPGTYSCKVEIRTVNGGYAENTQSITVTNVYDFCDGSTYDFTVSDFGFTREFDATWSSGVGFADHNESVAIEVVFDGVKHISGFDVEGHVTWGDGTLCPITTAVQLYNGGWSAGYRVYDGSCSGASCIGVAIAYPAAYYAADRIYIRISIGGAGCHPVDEYITSLKLTCV